MDIYVFAILKCRELKKNKKKKILWVLCRAYAHGKGPFGHFAKNPRGASLCSLGAGWCAAHGLCRAS
jgi:hypothetical protein